jgi:hypothetical protein
VNDQTTSVLTSRLHQLADELTPPLDVVGEVRAARSRRRRQRRVRIALVAAATVTAGALIGVPLTIDSLTSAPSGQVAGPVPTSSSSPTSAQEEADRRAVEEALRRARQAVEQHGADLAVVPDGWEPRAFQGVTFAVPPGARSADSVTDIPISSWTDGPSLVWNGPHLGGDLYSSVNVTITQPFEGGLPPREGGHAFTVPGAEVAYGNIETSQMSDGVAQAERTVVWLAMLDGDRVVHLDAVFDGGPSGEQMAQDLVASLAVG